TIHSQVIHILVPPSAYSAPHRDESPEKAKSTPHSRRSGSGNACEQLVNSPEKPAVRTNEDGSKFRLPKAGLLSENSQIPATASTPPEPPRRSIRTQATRRREEFPATPKAATSGGRV